MKRLSQHAFEPGEIMAYLDGELPANEAAELASHLDHCAECQSVAARMRQVSERMLDFQVEPYPAKVDYAALISLADREPRTAGTIPDRGRRQRRFGNPVGRIVPSSPLGWASAFGAVAVLILAAFVVAQRFAVPVPTGDVRLMETDKVSPLYVQPSAPMPQAPSPIAKMTEPQGTIGRVGGNPSARATSPNLRATTRRGLGSFSAGANQATTVVQGPMIVQTASITILATNYDQASGAIQRITTQHGGYVQELNASTPTGAARSLSATLRVPEKQLDACLTDLRKLGHVEQEWRNNQEITDQYIDLTARLKNARAEEQRIIELLATRTGKLSDVLEAERELARVRGEIESMAGQRAYMEHQVSYATVQLQLNEEYRAQLNSGAASTGTRIRNSLVEGFRNLGDGVVGMLLFVFAYGPSILFWLALIGVPAWLGWRRWRRGRQAAH
jgi:Domain of unknown function (DUF4349)/Putative zinc-finger